MPLTSFPMPLRCLAALALLLGACATPALERHEFVANKMGTEFRLVLYARDETRAARAAELAFARIDELEMCLSDYSAESELSRLPARSWALGASRPVAVSADLWRVLVAAAEVSRSSEGAFDISVGPLVRLWRRARRQQRLPDAQRLERALATVGHEWIVLEEAPRGRVPATHHARLAVEGMRLDLGGIAKGFALDQALAVLRAAGIECALVDGGGDVRVGRAPPGRDAWHVRIEAPGTALGLALVDSALATSGDAFQFFELEGVRYSHIIDPRTGQALTNGVTVSVIARDGMTADSVASAASVLGPQRGPEWVEGLAGAEARFVWLENAALRTCETTGFKRMMAAQQERTAAPPGPSERSLSASEQP